jgi:heptosyltransferase-2
MASTRPAKNILIVKHGALGDVVRTAYFARFRKEDAQSKLRIWWKTSNASRDLLRYNPHIDRVCMDWEDLAELRFDEVFSLDDEIEVIEQVMALRYTVLHGALLVDGRPTYTEDAATWFDMGLLSKFGKTEADQRKKVNSRSHAEIFKHIFRVSQVEPHFFLPPEISDFVAREIYCRDNSYFSIGLNAFAGDRWKSKALRTPVARELISRLLAMRVHGRPVRVVLLGGLDVVAQNRALCEGFSTDRLSVAETSRSVLEFAAVIAALDYLVTADSLALHLAIAQAVPSLSFFAPTSAAEIDTFGNGVQVLSQADDYCSYRSDADNRSITTERLMIALEAHLENGLNHTAWSASA